MDTIFVPTEGQISTVILPHEISNNINDILLSKIKNEIEGKCCNIGYIQKNSLKIIQKSLGSHLTSHFNGTIMYLVKYIANICNPVEGMKIKCKIININKMGILAHGGDDSPSPLNILLARQHHVEDEYFNKLQINDEIYISVLGKRFEYGDNQISIIGKLIDNPDLYSGMEIDLDSEKEEEIDLQKQIESKPKKKLKIVDQNVIHYFNRTKVYKQLTPSNIDNTFIYKGRNFQSVEHAFQSEKNENSTYKDLFTIGSDTYIGKNIAQVKKAGSNANLKKLKLNVLEEWDLIKNQVMEDITKEYLKVNLNVKKILMDTKDKLLIHKGVGVDDYWGVNSQGEGQNIHGKILMKLREEFN